MQAQEPLPISIARHTIQFIWQTTLSAQANHQFGLLGDQGQGLVDCASPTVGKPSQALDTQDVSAITTWKKQWLAHNIALAGVYQCTPPNAKQMLDIENTLLTHFKENHKTPLLHLYIHFDTKGVLECQAWILQNEQAVQFPIQLCEDGQPATKS